MKVRLKRLEEFILLLQILFQIHEGPIKTTCTRLRMNVGTSLNSMKVRLKHETRKR